jgi:hypothetical protein
MTEREALEQLMGALERVHFPLIGHRLSSDGAAMDAVFTAWEDAQKVLTAEPEYEYRSGECTCAQQRRIAPGSWHEVPGG